jgi:hypothetical protein
MNKNDRVKLTGYAKNLLGDKKDRMGTVRGFSRDGKCAWVVWDGLKPPGYSFSQNFLELVEPPPVEHPSGLSGEHSVVLDAIHQECLHGN